ncbi:hypothetical protein HY405_00430 [Candidatus Microgenomates bacterium]|nr:hypothetical protein [Candidatus Microgenomates bacterium]
MRNTLEKVAQGALISALALNGVLFSIEYTLTGSVLSPITQVQAWSTKTISAKALTDHECDSSEWHFVITQIESESKVPSSITVSWQNGASETISMWKYTGKTAHYVTTSNLDSLVTSATTTIYGEWDGQFNLSHGPCGQVSPTPTPSGSPTPTPTTCPSCGGTSSTPTPTPSGSPTPTPTPSSTPGPSATPTPSSTPQVLAAAVPSVLPATGANILVSFLALIGMIVTGLWLRRRARIA